MLLNGRTVGLLCISVLAAGVVGCATEQASVRFSYVVDPAKGLPPGMKIITIEPASLGETTHPKWSELSVSIMQKLVNESRDRFGTDIVVSDRRDAQVTFDTADLEAAGMATGSSQPGSGGQLLGAQGTILSTINVKIDRKIGKQRTLSNLFLAGGGGKRRGGGAVDIDTEEVETVTRSFIVQTEFKLLDTSNNRVWDPYAPPLYRSTDRTKASPIFGSSQTEAELTPEDQVIAPMVQRGARAFISRLMPCRIDVEAFVVSSTNGNCTDGVRLLRAEAYESALGSFRAALSSDRWDHQAAFGAGVACEALGRCNEALEYYRQACAGQESAKYQEARDRMKTYGDRVRK